MNIVIRHCVGFVYSSKKKGSNGVFKCVEGSGSRQFNFKIFMLKHSVAITGIFLRSLPAF